MEVNILPKKLKVKCPNSCKGIILDADRGLYCKHIETKMRHTKTSVRALLQDDIQRLPGPMNPEEELLQKEEYKLNGWPEEPDLRDLLKLTDLQNFEIDIIVAKLEEDKSLREIAEEQGWPSRDSVNYRWVKAIETLRKRGIRK